MNLIYNNKTPVGINYNNNEIETLNYNEEPVWENTPYKKLEYIESVGKQYIDMNTANILVDGCRIEASLSFASPTERQCIFGTEVANPFYRNYLFKTSSGFECGAYNYNNISYSVEVNQVLAIDYSTVKGNNYLKINNSTIWSNKDNHDRASTSSYLFAFHHRFNYAQAFAKMKLYYFKMYNSTGELIRDFIPIRRKSDNEICLYDKVSKEFYTNQGTGEFTAGPEI